MEKALNRPGATMPQRVFTPPRKATTANVGTNVTAPGIISVERIKKKTKFRPRAGMRASA